MRILRAGLLLLLVALLPFRGAMAAVALCPAEGQGTHSEVQLHEQHRHHGDHGHDVAGMQAHAQSSADAATQQDHHHDRTDHPDKCSLCAACCAGVPLISAAPTVPEPHRAPAATFPALSTPALGFVADRQERPPRSI